MRISIFTSIDSKVMQMVKLEWVEHNVCQFCQARAYHSCSWVSCLPAIEVAEKYYDDYKDVVENENGIEKH